MQKGIFSLLVLVIFTLTSCEKKSFDVKDANFDYEAAFEEAIVLVGSSDYKRVVQEMVEEEESENEEDDDDCGGNRDRCDQNDAAQRVIDYVENEVVTTTIQFKKGNKATKITEEGETEISLKKEGEDFEKVIVEPIVKSEDCDYIIAGMIKYFKDGKWLATVDYGDGTCDDVAIKTTKEGEYEFSLNYDDKEWGEKE